MRRRLIFGGLLLLILMCAGALLFAILRDEGTDNAIDTVTVTDAAGLNRALVDATAGTAIRLSPGSYGYIKLSGKSWEKPVTVSPEIDDDIPLFTGMELHDISGLHLSGLKFSGRVQAQKSHDFRIANSQVGDGVYLRDGTTNSVVENNQIFGGRFGVWVRNGANTPINRNVIVRNNDIAHQTGDNIQIGICDDLIVEDNRIHDIEANDDHNDGIQVMGGSNIVIRRNRFWNQDQAILLKAEPILGTDVVVQNARLENNLAVRSRGAGFIVAGAKDVAIVNNTAGDNVFADIQIEGDNPNLRIWNNVVRQIHRVGATPPTYQDHNCVLVAQQRGARDIKASANLDKTNDYRLTSTDPCAKTATDEGAPTDDLDKRVRRGSVTAGALQLTE